MPSRQMDARVFTALLVCGLALGSSGCKQKVQAAAPVASAPVPKAAEPPPPTGPAPDVHEDPGTTAPSSTPEPLNNSTTPPPPPPTHKPKKSEPATEQPEPAHPDAPQMSPQLSPNDQAAYERKTNEDLSVADKNLESATGHQLNAAQKDLDEKIRSFVSQSRDASKAGDWARAQNLAQKARLLSVELVNSL
jgi:hypothetical protein